LPAVVYSPCYDITFFGLERLHPFDSRKYSRAWKALRRSVGDRLDRHHVPVDRPATEEELLLAHSADYLARMRRSGPITSALELPGLGWLPAWLLRWRAVRPMLYAVRGSVLAARAALEQGVAVNLSGGYHHAKPGWGEGFCLFSDIAVLVRQLRADGLIRSPDRIAYVDLDAHQGNGVCHQFVTDRDVFLFDMYNASIYPFYDKEARQRIDCDLPLPPRFSGGDYIRLLKARLPAFLDSVSRSERVALGVYNAGTDVYEGDRLGGLALSVADVLERDLFVIDQFRSRGVPVVMLPSGGYSAESFRLIAATVERLFQEAPRRPA
jgi:histone deacetylase 11